MEQTKEKYLGRDVHSKLSFKEKGTFKSFWAAEGWLSAHGFSYGSTAYGRGVPGNPVAICKGEYNLPQKWHNLSAAQKKSVVGVITSNDFREGDVTIIFFEE